MNGLIDTHCHLTHGKLTQRVTEILDNARAAGVCRFICAAGTVHESKAAASLAEKHDDVFATAGVHPHDAKTVTPDCLRIIKDMCLRPRNVALGEIGLDYHYDFSPRADQQRVFAEQLELAKTLNVPVVIHTREAFDDTLSVLSESGFDTSRIVFHSFTGSPQEAARALDLGATISYSGIVTFRKTDELRAAAALTPDDRLMVETDSPYLSPEPVRNMKTNEPANVAHVAARLAQVRNTSPERIAELTTMNAERFFSLNQE